MLSLSGKLILIVQGPGLAAAELRAELERRGAAAVIAENITSAFSLVECLPFDGVLIDRALQNEVFDFYTELQALYIPYASVAGPRFSQNPASRMSDAEKAVNNLLAVFSQDMDEAAEEWLTVDLSSEPKGSPHRYPRQCPRRRLTRFR